MTGKRIRDKRESRGLTRSALSDLSGVPESTISKIELGTTRNPTMSTLSKLARALGCRVDDLCTEAA